MNELVTNYIKDAPHPQRAIMETIRKLIHESIENVVEEYKWSRPVFKKNRDFAYLQTNKNHVNLGFYSHFEKLNDPDQILQGSGKTMRHIKFKQETDINLLLLKEWLLIVSRD